jgi:hypothetical protein
MHCLRRLYVILSWVTGAQYLQIRKQRPVYTVEYSIVYTMVYTMVPNRSGGFLDRNPADFVLWVRRLHEKSAGFLV